VELVEHRRIELLRLDRHLVDGQVGVQVDRRVDLAVVDLLAGIAQIPEPENRPDVEPPFVLEREGMPGPGPCAR